MTDSKALIERLRQLSGNTGKMTWVGDKPMTARDALTRAADRIEALEAENERLRGALDAVWKEATTMRNASKLVGPYPTNPADNRIWARSMYHAGKRIMEMLKPARAALEGTSHE